MEGEIPRTGVAVRRLGTTEIKEEGKGRKINKKTKERKERKIK